MARKIEFEIGVQTDLKSVEDLNNELGQLSQEFESVAIGSQRFKELGRQIQSTEAQLKNIDLQFESLDREQRTTALVDTFNGLVGAVGAVSSAFLAFGVESEAIEEVEKKLLGVIGVVQGVSEATNGFLAAQKAFPKTFEKIGGAITGAFTNAAGGVNKLKVALASLGIGVLIILIDQLIQNWDKVSAVLGIATDKQKKYNDALLEAEAGQQQLIFELNAYNDVVQDTTKSEEERAFALQQLNKLGVNTEDITLANAEALDELNERIEKQTKLIVARAKAEAAASLLQQALEAQLKAESSSLEENIGFWEKLGNQVLYGGSVYGQAVVNAKNATEAAENQGKAVSEAQAEVDRATKVYEQTLAALLPLEAENSEQQTKVKEALERRAKAEKDLEKAVQERANLEKQAQAEVARITEELEVLRADESEKEIVRIKQSYADRLELLKQVYGEESEEVKNLLTLQNAEITDFEKDLELKKEQELSDLKAQIREAEANTVAEQREFDLQATETYYNDLIAQAEAAGLETAELEASRDEALNAQRAGYREEDKENATQIALAKKEAEVAIENAKFGLLAQAANLAQDLAGENKAVAIGAVIASQAAAIGQIIASTGLANAKATAVSPLTAGQPWVTINTIAAGLSIASAVNSARKSIQQINSSDKGGSVQSPGRLPSGGGGGGVPSLSGGISAGIGAVPDIPTPGGVGQEQPPIQTYVLAGDVTDAQDASAQINNLRKV